MVMEISYVFAFTTGLLGGTHCMGMCGPIVASYTLQGIASPAASHGFFKKIIPHLLYNLGRVTTYAFIGSLMGLSGSLMSKISGMQQIIMIVAGLIMILMGVNITGLIGGILWLERRNSLILKAGRVLIHEQTLWKYYILGSLFAFLPCGLSFSVFMAAAGTGSPISGMMLALLFGLGTLPWLLIFGVASSYISSGLRGSVYRLTGVLVIFMGILFLLRGINSHA